MSQARVKDELSQKQGSEEHVQSLVKERIFVSIPILSTLQMGDSSPTWPIQRHNKLLLEDENNASEF